MSGENLHPENELLTSYLLGRLPIEEEVAVERHLDGCPTCASLTMEMQPVDELVQLVSASRVHERHNRKDEWNPGYTVADDRVSTSGSAAESGEIEHLPEPPWLETESLPSELRNHPRYRVIRLLGRGGMGTVWLAEHLVLGRHVALKFLRSDWTDRSSKVARFRREIQASAKLSHPNIATVHDAERVGDLHFLVMEYVEGETLAEIVSRGALPMEEACRVIRDAARGLAHAHATGLVHRDVKPGNLMRTPKGEVKVLDFGLVVSLEQSSSLTGPAIVMGTPDYISPEQAEDPHTADERSDIYSLGCTFYHLLAGRPPFDDTSILRRINAHRERLAPEIPGIPEDVAAILRRMMNKSPGERYWQATEVAEALDSISSSFAVDASKMLAYGTQRTVETFQVGQAQPLITHVAEPVTSINPATALQARGRSSGLNRRLSGLILGLLLLMAGAVYRIQTDRGELVIETKDDAVEVIIKQNGNIIELVDTTTSHRVILKSGVYDLELSDNTDDGLSLNLQRAEIRRGKTVIATIRKEIDGDLPDVTESKNSHWPGKSPLAVRDFRWAHGLTNAELQSWIGGLDPGFVPVFLETAGGSGLPRFNVIAVDDGFRFEVQYSFDLDLGPINHMTNFNTMMDSSWSLRAVCPFDVADRCGRHHVWVRDHAAWAAHGSSLKGMQSLLGTKRQQNNRPIQIYRNDLDTGKGTPGRPYSTLWGRDHDQSWEAATELTIDELKNHLEAARDNGRIPVSVSSFGSGADRTYSCVTVVNLTQREWQIESTLSSKELEQSINTRKAAGLRPLSITSEILPDGEQFFVVFVPFSFAKQA